MLWTNLPPQKMLKLNKLIKESSELSRKKCKAGNRALFSWHKLIFVVSATGKLPKVSNRTSHPVPLILLSRGDHENPGELQQGVPLESRTLGGGGGGGWGSLPGEAAPLPGAGQPSCSQARKGQEKHLSGNPTPPNTPKVSLHRCKSPFIDTELPHQTLHWPELLHTTLTPTFMGYWEPEKPNPPGGGC